MKSEKYYVIIGKNFEGRTWYEAPSGETYDGLCDAVLWSDAEGCANIVEELAKSWPDCKFYFEEL